MVPSTVNKLFSDTVFSVLYSLTLLRTIYFHGLLNWALHGQCALCFYKHFRSGLQLDHSNVAFVMDSVFINIQLTVNNCLSKGFPHRINEIIYENVSL